MFEYIYILYKSIIVIYTKMLKKQQRNSCIFISDSGKLLKKGRKHRKSRDGNTEKTGMKTPNKQERKHRKRGRNRDEVQSKKDRGR